MSSEAETARDQNDREWIGLSVDGETVHLPAFISALFNVPTSRARMLIATKNVRVASHPCDDLDVKADGRYVTLSDGRGAYLPKPKDGRI